MIDGRDRISTVYPDREHHKSWLLHGRQQQQPSRQAWDIEPFGPREGETQKGLEREKRKRDLTELREREEEEEKDFPLRQMTEGMLTDREKDVSSKMVKNLGLGGTTETWI